VNRQGTKVTAKEQGLGVMGMRANQTAFRLIATWLAAVSAVSSGRAAIDVKLRERVVPRTSVVRLGDVADVAAADRQKARRLAAVPLMPAPAPDTQRFLQQREIADMLAAGGVDLAEIRFDGAPQVGIAGRSVASLPLPSGGGLRVAGNASVAKRNAIMAGASAPAATVRLNESQSNALKALVGRMIGEQVKSKSGKAAIGEIACDFNDRQLAQLAMATSAPVCAGGSAPWTGRQNFVFSFDTPAGPASVQVTAEIAEPPFPAIVATRPVARGGVITAADVELRMVEATARTAGTRPVADSVERIIGQEARQPLKAGEVVFADQVKSPLLVKRGDLISVGSQGGGVRVRTSARALQDGANGELIQVEALESKQRYDARVVGLRQATIFTPTRVEASPRAEKLQTARVGPLGN
jgi:flagella basal body P-ring formation protein FlgA